MCVCWCLCVRIHAYLLVHACTHTHTSSLGCIQPAAARLTDSRHGLSRMSGEDTAALTSFSLPINTKSSITSAPAPDPRQALSKAGQCGINSEIIHTACRGSVLFQFKVNSFVIVKRRLHLGPSKLFIYNCLWMLLGFNPICLAYVFEKKRLFSIYNDQLRKHVFSPDTICNGKPIYAWRKPSSTTAVSHPPG